MVGLVDEVSESDQASWLTHFDSVSTTGYTWAEGSFSPIFQKMGIIKTGRLLHDGDRAYPRLSDISVELAGSLEEPVLLLSTQHPYATGFRLVDGDSKTEVAMDDTRWPMPLTAGRHQVEAAVLTDYGSTIPRHVTYEVAKS